ncbi:hypothetical protein K470DRAFT_294841 [Piedraia hortae CBS 480.64]|uniref:Uncharacterized protein n=1 Tax=Piedraia hortae CBS 480.64 TaxID=1314780 RepID=A0A6A7BZW8_9PEZI|nr:hypothetical protein K470DRAFT_294841 [Piedraia hortae CBS 480.64]
MNGPVRDIFSLTRTQYFLPNATTMSSSPIQASSGMDTRMLMTAFSLTLTYHETLRNDLTALNETPPNKTDLRSRISSNHTAINLCASLRSSRPRMGSHALVMRSYFTLGLIHRFLNQSLNAVTYLERALSHSGTIYPIYKAILHHLIHAYVATNKAPKVVGLTTASSTNFGSGMGPSRTVPRCWRLLWRRGKFFRRWRI